ncbi:MAG: ATP-binding protein [Cyanobacteria bacterium P01_D01_bin.50]
MKTKIFSDRKNREFDQNTSKSFKLRIFSSVRFRILAWYFLLTTSTVLLSVGVTRHIFCDVLQNRTQDALVAEVGKFNRLVEQNLVNDNPSKNQLESVVERVLPLHIAARDEYILTLVKGRIFKSNQLLLPKEITQNSQLITEWETVSDLTRNELILPDGPIYYVAKPIKINGTKGVVVAIRDARADYQTGTQTIILVIKVATVVLTLFFIIAWISAGRVLFPLRQVTEAAREITQTDMSKRISAVGNDEIAELSATFNAMLDRLQLAFETQQEFLKDAGHELRTPITIIQGHLEVLKYRPEKQNETIELVTDELNRMNRLVNDLLLIARAEQPHFLRIKPEELDWFTEELYFKVQAMAKRDWRLESKGLSPVAIDRGRLTQAVMNLVQNAIRYTAEGDTIALGSAVRDDYAYLWVRDTGIGIARENQERIFERFARASDSDNPNGDALRDRYSPGEGAGLGLSIVEAIAYAHNGWVELDSTLGIGSTFTIVFPISEDTANEPNSHRRRQPTGSRVYRSRIASARIRNSCR